MNILIYLDNQIETFRQKKGDYPTKITLNKVTYDQIFSEIDSAPTEFEGWAFKKDNYRGIPLEIRDISFIKLEG